MKYEKYVSLIEHLEDYAAKNPKLYQYRVVALALLGYSYIIGLILVCILLPVLIFAALLINPGIVVRLLLLSLKLWWIFLPGTAVFGSFLIGAIRSLTAKVPEPVGNEIVRGEAVKLFEFIEKICVELKAQRPEKILLNDEFNASVVTIPRFGIFGRRVYLNLGLPLMYAVSPEQFRAVLTHEIGHISAKHGAFSKWAYQLHETWRRFIESQELQEHKFSVLYEKFVNWFFPYFSAYLFVLMRKHEREADKYTVQLVGTKPLGEALINLEVKGTILSQNFWQEVFEENMRQDKPPTELFSRMATAFRSQNGTQETQNLIKFIAVKTDYSDTHPSLAERLKASGYWTEGDLPKLPEAAAETYVGNLLEKYTREYNREWQNKMSENWKANFDYLQNTQKRLEELNEKETLTAEELFEKARLTAERQGNAAALPFVRQLVEMHPEHAEANYILGGMLIEIDDENGFEYLDKAMRLDARWKLAASEIAFEYLRRKGRYEEAKPYVEIIENQQENVQKAEVERSVIHSTDHFEPHQLPDETLGLITKKISYHDEIESAYLVCKTVQFFPEIPLYVLFLTLKSNLPKGVGAVRTQDLVDTIADQAGEFGIRYIYAFGKNEEQYRKKIAAVEKSKIFGEETEKYN